ncbi:hypothetical protein CC99x_005175 [Candidatus Berkiella cookevillensis]|uniref:Uncharacterized protein n=1 Tax=Candidatus Berkiella cookevillensis TaxID=437022 RepID=A0A0Q9YR06_9GAMM|nr:hypothetical protein [Candidatus Berkiella cookevillensis]MCS5708292.1 hypothetical protein [Candidatus Berkiella cookevillensis]
MAASGPIDKANQKIELVSRLVTATYAESIQASNRSESDINAHIEANPFLSNEFIFDAELKKYQNRWDKLALILQRILGAKEILEHYLKNSELRGILPESSVENMSYLQDWCENKFEREADYKAFEALLKTTLAELYTHESYFYNMTSQTKLCAEIRVKFDTLAAQPLDTKYLYMIFSSYQNLWLNKQKVLEQPIGLSQDSEFRMGSSSSSSSHHAFNDVQLDVVASISVKTNNKIPEAPPPPPPLLPLWKATCSSSSSQQATVKVRAVAKAAFSVDNNQLLNQARVFKEKRNQKMAQAQRLEFAMPEEQVIEQEILENKKAKPVDPREAHLKSMLEKSAEKASRRNGEDFEAVVSRMRSLQLTKNAAQLSCQAATSDSDSAEKGMPASSSNSNDGWVNKFIERQRARASGAPKSDDEENWSDDDFEDKKENTDLEVSVSEVSLSERLSLKIRPR